MPLSPPDIVDATRRDFLAALAAGGLLAGCGTSGTPEPAATPGYPRTVPTPRGPLTLTGRPERVVATSSFSVLDHLLTLGVVPAVSMQGDPFAPWQLERGAADAVPLDDPRDPNLETLVRERVDLVVTDEGVDAGRIALYERAAPVLLVPSDTAAALRLLGEAFDRADLAETQAARHEDLLNTWVPPWRPARVTALFVPGPGEVFVYGPGASFAPLLARLLAPLTDPGGDSPDGASVSLERLSDIDSDLVLVVDPYADTATLADEFEASPIVRGLASTQAGRLVRLDRQTSVALLGPSALATPVLLDALTSILQRTTP